MKNWMAEAGKQRLIFSELSNHLYLHEWSLDNGGELRRLHQGIFRSNLSSRSISDAGFSDARKARNERGVGAVYTLWLYSLSFLGGFQTLQFLRTVYCPVLE